MKNYIPLVIATLAGMVASEGTLTCPGGLQGLCTAPPYSCTCDFLKQVVCQKPPTLACNSFCQCV